jgi:hypothetical protein
MIEIALLILPLVLLQAPTAPSSLNVTKTLSFQECFSTDVSATKGVVDRNTVWVGPFPCEIVVP